MMIDNDKIGNYIKQLRKNSKMTQEDLATKLYVSRQAVSNWETGKDVPTVDNVKDICIIFNVSIADIYAGEEVKDIKTLNDIIHSLVTMEMKKSKKIMIISSVIIFLLIIMFLVYYFITYYNNITEYVITTDNNNYKVFGVINKTVDNIYFELSSDQTSNKICLVYKENDLLCNTNSNFIRFSETNGYNEIIPLDKKSFDDYINNLYVTIENDNNIEKIKLDVVNDYQNSNLFKEHNIEITKEDNDYKLEFASVPEKIRKEFNYNKDSESFNLNIDDNGKKIEMNYLVNLNTLFVNISNSKEREYYIYNLNDKNLESYKKITNNNKSEIINNIMVDEKDKNKKIIYDNFKENYIDKYIY